jgi:hypothetical protein
MGDGHGSKLDREGQTADMTNVSIESKKISRSKYGYTSARARSGAREVRGDVETGSGFKTLDALVEHHFSILLLIVSHVITAVVSLTHFLNQ